MSYDYGSIQPGYKNPLEGSGSIKGDYDWGSFSKGVDWDQTPGIDKSGLFESLFDKTKKTDKWRSRAEEDDSPFGYKSKGFYGGEWSRGGGGRILDNLSVVQPQQLSPMFIPGQEGKPGFLGGGGGKALAGIAGLALAPLTGGASLAFAPMVGQAAEAAGRTWSI